MAYSVYATTSATTPSGDPTVPVLQAYALPDANWFQLVWDAADGASSYRLEKSLIGTHEWSEVVTLASGQPREVRPGVLPGSTCYYRLFAISETGESEPSNVIRWAAAPDIPVGLTAIPGENHIELQWEEAVGASGYKLERSTDETNWFEIYDGGNLSHTETGLSDNTTYYFRLSAYSADMIYSTYVTANATTLQSIAPAPTGLAITNPTNSSLRLSWSEVPGSTGYRLERSLSGTGGWAAVYSGTATVFNDTALSSGTVYYYRVFAVNTGGDSSASPVVNKITISPAPTGVSATGIDESGISITWNAAQGATTYTVEWSLNGSSGWTAISPTTATETSHSALAANTTYYYRVKATNASGDSSWSSTASGKTAPAPPSSFTATVPASPNGQTQVVLSWSASVGATSYLLEVSPDGVSGWTQIYAGSAMNYTHTGLTPNTPYYYRLKVGS